VDGRTLVGVLLATRSPRTSSSPARVTSGYEGCPQGLTQGVFLPETNLGACHSERSEASLAARRCFASLRMAGQGGWRIAKNLPVQDGEGPLLAGAAPLGPRSPSPDRESSPSPASLPDTYWPERKEEGVSKKKRSSQPRESENYILEERSQWMHRLYYGGTG
jgi:hypothetical protein